MTRLIQLLFLLNHNKLDKLERMQTNMLSPFTLDVSWRAHD